jgi:methyl-accepting chemotaxis protein
MITFIRFVRSRSGRILLIYLALSGVIGAGVGSYFYHTNLETFIAQKSAEKVTALQLVDAFVTTYARVRSEFGPGAPVPATFRAHSIESFNQRLGSNSAFMLRWVGRQGRQIATAPVDAEMARAIEEYAATTDRTPKAELKTVNGRQVLRTIYPSLASEQSCVNCHNQLQPNGPQWRLNDVMGAFAIDVPVEPFLQGIKMQGYTVALGLFAALVGIGLAISIFYSRQLHERESVASELKTQNIRFNAALNNMAQGLCMFDADRRLVVCNERYARMYALPRELVEPGTRHEDIIKHRVAQGILAGERTDAAVEQKLAALNKHSAEKTSTRVDTLSDGRVVKVTRDPLPGGGWIATHEDVSETLRRDSIDSAISSFRHRVESVLKTVRDCAKAMNSTATDLLSSSERTSQRANGILQASQEASSSVEHAAAATREMSSSATEIGRQIDKTNQVVRSAVGKVKATNDEFSGLSNAAQKIGDVINLIQQISGQTNLLALNATIEAARAGEAGRGFAVVASEVKSLALQTGKAAEEVVDQISAVQASTSGAINAVGSIEECIREISTVTSSVAGSVEEQRRATLHISNNVANAAQETSKIVLVLSEVVDGAVATRAAAQTVLTASESVEKVIENLRGEVETFLGDVAPESNVAAALAHRVG